MSHYLNKQERADKTALLLKKQQNPKFDIRLRLLKDDHGWYADVPSHTRSENAMVSGADKLCDLMAGGGNELIVRFRTVKDPNRKALCTLVRFTHITGVGATYLANGLSIIPFPVYLCDVTHNIVGEHPRRIWVYSIKAYNNER